MAIEETRKSPMMSHLMDALDRGENIGHYGRLVFAMVAHHFADTDEVVRCLTKGEGVTDEEARSLCRQVEQHDYNPPQRDRIIEWQKEQEFPICPDIDDPDACNVYRELRFPDHVYRNIEKYYEKK